MISFPILHEDELFYSCCARYHRNSGNTGTRATVLELFNSSNVCATILFPSHLQRFCSLLPIENSIDPEYLINYHSLLPYFSPFIPMERFLNVKDHMVFGSGTAITMTMGIAASHVKRKPHLYFCPVCVVEDTEKVGEAYWHRTHQAFGVDVCYKHFCALVPSQIDIHQRNKHEYMTLSTYLVNNPFQRSSNIAECNEVEKYIAEQSYILLKNTFHPIGKEKIRQFYINRLKLMGYITTENRIRWQRLIYDFVHQIGESFLVRKKSLVTTESQFSWVHKLLREPRHACHPLRHLFLLKFLNESVQSLLTETLELQIVKQTKFVKDRTYQTNNNNNRVNWAFRDEELAKMVPQVAQEIRSHGPRYVQITKTEITRRLGVQALIIRSIHKLPLTKAAIINEVESVEQFQFRRIEKAIEKLEADGIDVKRWIVMRGAGIKKNTVSISRYIDQRIVGDVYIVN
jgi:hypothetical protein